MTSTPPQVFRVWFVVVWVITWVVSAIATAYFAVIIGLIDENVEVARQATLALVASILLPWVALGVRVLIVRGLRRSAE